MKVSTSFLLSIVFFLAPTAFVFSQPFSGGSGTPEDPWQISSATELDSLRHYLNGSFIITEDIDLDIAPYNTGQGWEPIGDYSIVDTFSQFTGNLDGAGHSITGLYINRGSSDKVGLFSILSNASISNLLLSKVNVLGSSQVGGLAGVSSSSKIDSSSVTGKVTGVTFVGGMVGVNSNSSVMNSSSEVNVFGNGNSIGGLAGENINGATIANSYSGGMGRAKVEGENNVGGLVGDNNEAKIVNSYATASIFGTNYIGGLIGSSRYSRVETSYSTGPVSGSDDFAGFIGYSNGDTLTANYWNTETSGQKAGANVRFPKDGELLEDKIAGLTTVQMTNQDNFIGWDFDNAWDVIDAQTYPLLQWQGGPTPANEASYGPPINLSATVIADTTALTWGVALVWNTPAIGFPKSYNIYRSGELLDVITVANPEAPIASDTTWTDSTTTNFTPYFYYVTAVYDKDEEELESAPSNQVQVVAKTGLPGAGTEDAPWHIATPHELNALRYLSSGNFKLVQDINLEQATTDSTGMFWNNGKGWMPVSVFEGSLDGDGHIISGIYINRPNFETGRNSGTGFFSSILSGEIKNLGLVDVNVTGASSTGGLSGSVSYSVITNSFVRGMIKGGFNVGGLVGNVHSSSSISVCYSTGEISGNGSVGGLIGELEESTMKNSYSISRVYGRDMIGGLVGENDRSTIEKSYAAGAVEGLYETGGIAGLRLQGTFRSNFWDVQTTGQQYGVSSTSNGTTGLTAFQMVLEESFLGWDFETVWDINEGETYPWLREIPQFPPPVPDSSRFITDAFAGGSGTEEDPWKIATAVQLDSVRHYLKGNYILTADIDLDISPYNQGKGWQPIGQDSSYADLFSGSFDGNNHIVSGLYINRPNENKVGLFGYLGISVEVQKIGLTDVDVTGDNMVGSLAGELYAGNISKSYATGTVKGTNRVGGLVGYHFSNSSFISKSYTAVNVSGNGFVGGLVGSNAWSAQISDSYAIGNVEGKEWTGGFAGSNTSASISRSYAAGKVSGEASVGGFLGYTEQETLSNNFWDTDSSTQSVGIGDAQGSMNGVTGLSSEEMRQPGFFSNWNFDIVWDIQAGDSYPWLREIPQDPVPGLIVGTEREPTIPREFGLAQNYPNPFNPSTVISFQLPFQSEVSLQVFDVLGKEVATLVEGRKKAGYYDITFNAGRLASGMYIYRLKAGDKVITKKLMLIK